MPDLARYILRAEMPAVQKNAVGFLSSLEVDRPIEVVVKEYKPSRSDQQNRALWGVAYPPIMEAIGLRGEREREELHEFFCGEYFGWVEYKIMGRKKSRPNRSTTKGEDGKRNLLNKAEMMDFYDFIQQRSAEHGIYVPDPDPPWFEQSEA